MGIMTTAVAAARLVQRGRRIGGNRGHRFMAFAWIWFATKLFFDTPEQVVWPVKA
jgi:hypothetical protein